MSSDKWVPSPSNVVLLHNLVEIQQLWGRGVDAVYRAVRRGELHAFGRSGHQKYYADHELRAVFGEPATSPVPPALKRRDNRSDVTGGQQERFQFARVAEAA